MLIHGLPENRNKNTNQIVYEALKEKMGEGIKKVDLDRMHRLGAPKKDKVRLTVKLVRNKTRSRVFRNKKKIKVKKGQHNKKSDKDAKEDP